MLTLTGYYLSWHYSRSLRDYWGVIRNLLWFFYNFFSIPSLLRTLFVPFHRLTDNTRPKHALDLQAMGERLVVDSLMRLVGFILRSFVILVGLITLATTAVFGGLFFLVWLCAPLFTLFLLGSGVTLLIFS